MNRRLPTMLCGAFFLFLLTLTACDTKPPVVEVPGTDAEKQTQADGKKPEVNQPVTPFATSNIMDELEKLTRLPEDRSLESLMNFLTTGDEKLMMLAPLFERIPPEKQRQLELNRVKSEAEAADIILKNDAATPVQIRVAVNAKGTNLLLAYIQNDSGAFDKFTAEIAAYRKAGKIRTAWELELALLQVDTRRFLGETGSLEEVRGRAVELLATGKEANLFSPESLAVLMATILGMDEVLEPSEEGDLAVKTLRETLASTQPSDDLSKAIIENYLVQFDMGKLIVDFERTFRKMEGGVDPKPEDFDALFTGATEVLKKAESEKVSLMPMSVMFALRIAHDLEKRASAAKVTGLYDALLAALEAGESDEKATLVGQTQAAKRRFNLPGTEMELQALKPDGTPVSLKDFAGKVVLLDMLSLHHQQVFGGEYKLARQLQEMYKGTDLEIVWYLVGSRPEEIGQMIEMMGMTWNVMVPVPEGAGPAAPLKYYEIFELPRIFLIDRDGKVISTNINGDDLLIELHRLFPEVELPEVAAARVEATELEALGENLEPTQPLPMPEEVKTPETPTMEETPEETPVVSEEEQQPEV